MDIKIHTPNKDKIFEVGNKNKLFLIGGPCVLESPEMGFEIASKLKEITERLGIGYVFKTSFDKANRTSINSFRGINFDDAMATFDKVRNELNIPTTTDIHETYQIEKVAPHVDILQIPAFLCRQTDLIVAAAKSGKIVNIKKGQFLAPEAMKHSVGKCIDSGNENVLLMERGSTVMGQNLVVDPTSFNKMKAINGDTPVVFDGTHSAQVPSTGEITAGARHTIPGLCKAAISQGIAGLFMEIHTDPVNAKCDSTNQFPLDKIEEFLVQMLELDTLIKGQKEIEITQ